MFTKEEKDIIKKYLPLIEQVVKDQSISNIPFQFRTDIIDIAVRYKLVSCIKCNSSLYLAIQRVYTQYVNELKEIKKQKKDSNGEVTRSRGRRSK